MRIRLLIAGHDVAGPPLGFDRLVGVDDAAKSLGQHTAPLLLDDLTTPSDEAAKALAQHKALLDLHGLTALDSPDSSAIARALATYKSRLRMPNLKKIFPRTLTALLEKEDVEIPLIETLELIPEPNDSVTEDFIVPECLSAGKSVKKGIKSRTKQCSELAKPPGGMDTPLV